MTFIVKRYQRPAIISRFLSPFRRRAIRRIDLRQVSEHLKRDIGLLDGHIARGGDGGRSI
ncbi:hypothetical protein [Rhodobacter sp. NSM]|uniref:hypothetical protein n=1 Tax=Rhodobacter sp. NSM TaxID=3457501 RepID=UPI003FD50C31